jgi:hypothetical protein
MDPNTSELERAFELAKSGRFTSVEQIRRQLKVEGYSTAHVTGKFLVGRLRAIIHSNAGTGRQPQNAGNSARG